MAEERRRRGTPQGPQQHLLEHLQLSLSQSELARMLGVLCGQHAELRRQFRTLHELVQLREWDPAEIVFGPVSPAEEQVRLDLRELARLAMAARDAGDVNARLDAIVDFKAKVADAWQAARGGGRRDAHQLLHVLQCAVAGVYAEDMSGPELDALVEAAQIALDGELGAATVIAVERVLRKAGRGAIPPLRRTGQMEDLAGEPGTQRGRSPARHRKPAVPPKAPLGEVSAK